MMKHLGLGISILLFAILFAFISTGLEIIALGIGITGLCFSIAGFYEKWGGFEYVYKFCC